MSRTEIKLRAKAEFKDHWGALLLILALNYVALCFAFLLGFGIGLFVVAGPLMVGIYYVYLNAVQNNYADWKDMFFGFKNMFADSFLVWILFSVMITIVNAILVIIGLIISAIIGKIASGISSVGDPYDYYDPYSYGYDYGYSILMPAASSFIAFLLISIAISIVLIIIALRYAETPILLLKEPGIRPVDALKKSRIMMKGRAGRLFIFDLSFIGWFILGALTFGLLYIYVGPYYLYARTMLLNQFYEERRNVSADDDEDLQKLNAMRASVRNRTEAVADKIKEKKAEHEEAKETAPAYEPQEPEPVEPEPIEPEPVEPEVPAAPNVCKYCGAKLPEGASFCGKCGNRQ